MQPRSRATSRVYRTGPNTARVWFMTEDGRRTDWHLCVPASGGEVRLERHDGTPGRPLFQGMLPRGVAVVATPESLLRVVLRELRRMRHAACRRRRKQRGC